MVETSFNLFDTVVIVIIALSALLSFFRGFVREVLSLGAWVGASIITVYTFPDVALLIEPQIKNPTISSGLAAMGVFVFALMGISIFNALLMRLFKKGKDIGMLDNGLGLVFGVFRACLLVSLGYFIFSFFKPESDYPEWLAEAQTRPYVEAGATMIARVAPKYLSSMSPIGPEGGDGIEEENPLAEMFEKKRMEDGTTEKDGPEWMNVEELERIIEDRETGQN